MVNQQTFQRRMLARERAMAAASLPAVATIIRSGAAVSDNAGGSLPAADTRFTLPCAILATGGNPQEQLIAGRIQGRAAATLLFALDADVRLTDRITVDGRAFEPVGKVAQATVAVVQRIVCQETTP